MSNKISLFQNDRNWQQIRHQVLDLVDQHHSRGVAQNGELCQQVEQVLAQRFNRKYCVTTANCTDALAIAIQCLNLKPNSRVAVPNYTFTATAHAVSRAGHQVCAVDVNKNYCIDTNNLENYDAVIAVDLFGNMCDWNKLKNLSTPVINDAAQSLESRDTQGWSAGKGKISCISFSPSKTISSWGSGGALLTDDADIAEQAQRLRLHGKISNDQHATAPGLNSMMSTMELACVLVGLEYSESWQQRRHSIARYLSEQSKYSCAIDFDLPQHTYSKLVFQSSNITKTQEVFRNNNVDCVVHYRTLVNDEKIYHKVADMSTSNRLKQISFTVPNQHTLTDSEVEHIARILK